MECWNNGREKEWGDGTMKYWNNGMTG